MANNGNIVSMTAHVYFSTSTVQKILFFTTAVYQVKENWSSRFSKITGSQYIHFICVRVKLCQSQINSNVQLLVLTFDL